MRTVRMLAGALLTGAVLAGPVSPAVADSPSPSPAASDEAGPTEAGTTFRTATLVQQDQRATADASTGDYLYWVFPADTGQRVTVTATVTPPDSAARHGASTWQLDAYDGLRRRQACTRGANTRVASQDTASVQLSCTLRPVRSWAEPWANDPLPGSYYVRLTVTDLAEKDLGLPVRVAVRATSSDTGGAHAVDGSLSTPLLPGAGAAQDEADQEPDEESASDAEPASPRALGEPEDGWSSGWWTDRWAWTVAAGVLGTLAGITGYRLAGGSVRRRPSPPAT
ncbi:hypothetical protein RM572_05245 [Streptomyces sp. DSM 42041]|uniref:Secreted protein n=1 Tax=Streptomyces hazeniae TaxID=3075538 RepID=A0ABU2NQ84_9ACTN|nr:hypothetical protein [Streptomyces sp. DSM 42041]MDT0378182.1 hypothetical protein [Streptomyces sp. DSM 42041]